MSGRCQQALLECLTNMEMHPPAYRLVRRGMPPAIPPRLDADQLRVQPCGRPAARPGRPGTGKTTAIVARGRPYPRRGIDPGRVLVLTFSRKAAQELREGSPCSSGGPRSRSPCFHSYAYAWCAGNSCWPTRAAALLPGPEQPLEVRRLLRRGRGRRSRLARAALAGARHQVRRGTARLPAPCSRARPDGRLARLGRQRGRADWEAAGAFLDRYAARFDLAPVPAYDYAEIQDRRAAARPGRGQEPGAAGI